MAYFVNVSCANIYRQPTFHSEVDTQAVLWEQVSIQQHKNDFAEIVSEDGYSGWINRRQIVEAGRIDTDNLKMVTQPFSFIYAESGSGSAPVRDVTAGGYLAVVQENDRWLNVLLPDGAKGWIHGEAFRPMAQLSREALIEYAQKFMGVPYVWGGKTAKGLDCSGFVQMTHKMFGLNLRRDAWMQFEDARPVSRNPLQGRPGDLMFFAEAGERITHVGFVLADGKLLHARGMVRINSLTKSDPDYDESLLKDFVEIRSYLAKNFAHA